MSVTLYTFNKSGFLITVVRDSDYLNIIDYFSVPHPGPDTPQPPFTYIISSACQSGTFDRYNYFAQASPPYARAEIVHNSPTCGYVPPTCDIYIKTFKITPELDGGNNSATINVFAVSSFEPITYRLIKVGYPDVTNTTGYFTGVTPGGYFVVAEDTNGCSVERDVTIHPFDTSQTHFKYRLKFIDTLSVNIWELRLLDMLNVYDSAVYPKDITGGEGSPVKVTTANQNEDKTESIIPTVLEATLRYTGEDFTPDEFISVPEKSWKVELYKNGLMYFQGWLLPDQTQDFYMDLPYEIQIQATDGLPSLKGNTWGDGSGGQGYSNFQTQQYGLARWKNLVKQCLDQLGYNYFSPVIVSSLRFNNIYSRDLWYNLSTWSDILYDSSGVAVDTYTALQNLLGAFKLCIFQQKGRFFMVNWNDLSYINNPLVADKFALSFYEFAEDWSNIDATGLDVEQPIIQSIGFKNPIAPINPPQSLNYDKPYNIEVDISFNELALLYENPSFEIGAVQGELPSGMVGEAYGGNDIVAYCNYDTVTASPGSGAFDGNWELRIFGYHFYYDPFTGALMPFLKIFPLILIDQYGMKLSFSFKWRPSFSTPGGTASNPIPTFVIIFKDQGITPYYWAFDTGLWIPLSNSYPMTGVPTLTNGDITGWQDFTTTTTQFPITSMGTIEVRFYCVPIYQPSHDPASYVGDGAQYVDYDMLTITQLDANPSSTLQVSESHYETAVTGIPNADLKITSLSLFTYPNNKRVAGNVFTLNDYLTGQVANLWNFNLSGDRLDRLPATVSKAIARNYSRPMYIFEGDFKAVDIQFYGMFILKYYEGRVFQPFSIMIDCRMATGHIIMIECDDSLAQFIYTYTAIYQNNARQNSN